METLQVQRLCKDFGGVNAVKNVSFSVFKGEHLAIIGPNGAGKSTLFNLIGGQIKPTSGKVFFEEKDITGLSVDKRTHLGFGRSFQIANLFMDLTVLENLLLALQGTRSSRFHLFRPAMRYSNLLEEAERLLESIELSAKKNVPVRAISYGDQRKLEISLSLASKPKILLLDEPSCGLTSNESADLSKTVLTFDKSVTVILVAHDMDLVFGIADRILVLHYGEIIVEGPPDTIRSDKKVREIYMGKERSEL